MNKDEKIKQLEAEVKRLRDDCAEAYQIFGAITVLSGAEDDDHKDIEKALDNLWAASASELRPHEDLLPWPKGNITFEPGKYDSTKIQDED